MKSRGAELVDLGEREYFVLMNFINIECIDTVICMDAILYFDLQRERERERERERAK